MNSAASIAASVIAASQPILPVGSGTKSALAASDSSVERLDVRCLSGVVSYEPSEFLISAQGGTPISQLEAALSEHGQYLPFDPMFVERGATLGGTVASGLSGSGHLLYGSLRDFVMEVELVDGLGKLVRGGGKVVKNAAGFDLPKLVVGSYGRLGVITEVTLKVFPRPPGSATLVVHLPNMVECIEAIQQLRSQPLPISALDVEPLSSGEVAVYVRFAGPRDSLASVLARASELLHRSASSLSDADEELQLWQERARAIERAGDATSVLVRIATTLDSLLKLTAKLSDLKGVNALATGAGSVTWLCLPSASDIAAVDRLLNQHQLAGVVVAGEVDNLRLLGKKTWLSTARRIQHAFDPEHKFASFETPASSRL